MKQLEILDNRKQSNKVIKTIEKESATEIFDFINSNEFYLYSGTVGLTEDIISEIKCAIKRTPSIFKNYKKDLEILEGNYEAYRKHEEEELDYDLIENGYNLVNNDIFNLMQHEEIADSVLSENLIDSINYIN